jgi:hypothetical protein
MKGPRTWISPMVFPSQRGDRCPRRRFMPHIHQRRRHVPAIDGAAIALVGIGGTAPSSAPRIRDGRQIGRCLGHAPALHEPHAVPVEGADQRPRAPLPRRPTSACPAGIFQRPGVLRQAAVEGLDQARARWSARPALSVGGCLLHQVEQVVRVQVRTRKHQLGADQHGGIRARPSSWRGTSASPASARRCPSGPRSRPGSRPACAARSNGANRPRPWAGRWCPTCSTSRPDRSRRAAGRLKPAASAHRPGSCS